MNGSDGLTIKEAYIRYRIGESTLRNWIKEGVCGDVELPMRRIRGRRTQVLMPQHIERLERYLLYRSWLTLQSFGGQIDLNQLQKLHLAVEDGDLKQGIAALRELEEILDDALEMTKNQIQSLHAKLYGDAPIDPNDVDLEY